MPLLASIRAREAEIRLALRMAFAAGLGYTTAKLLGLPQGYWVVITAIIVMQASLGGSVKAAADRMAGTLAGAAWGTLIAVAVPHQSQVTLGLAIILAIAPMGLLAALRANFRIAPITALIVLVPMSGPIADPFVHALERIVEIALGNVIGVAVALLVLPTRAHGILSASAARIADLNADLMIALIEGLTSEQGRPGLPAIHAKIRASLKQLETAADEATRERRSHLSDIVDPEPLVRTLYRVRHDLVMIGRATAKPLPAAVGPDLQPSLSGLRDASVAVLRAAAASMRNGAAPPDVDAFDASFKAYVAEMDALRTAGRTRSLASDDVGRLYALRFAFDQLGFDLHDLANRIGEQVGVRKDMPVEATG